MQNDTVHAIASYVSSACVFNPGVSMSTDNSAGIYSSVQCLVMNVCTCSLTRIEEGEE